MSAELGTIGVVTALKYIGGVIAAWIGWILKKNHDKLHDTLTKDETEHLIELKIEPIIAAHDVRFSEIMKAIEGASDERKENNMMLKNIHESVAKLNTQVAVLGNEVGNIKEEIKVRK